MEINLLDRMLNAYLAGRVPVTVTLQNKARLTGKIKAFDSYVIVMDCQKQELLYRHAVSTVAPALQTEPRRQSAPARPAATKSPVKPPRRDDRKPGHQPPAPSAAVETGINNGMKDGLLKWMQGQKAAK